jgi:hypothetical protein
MSHFYPWKKAEVEKLFWRPAQNFPEFSKTEIEVFIETFRQFDLDGSGGISASEVSDAFLYSLKVFLIFSYFFVYNLVVECFALHGSRNHSSGN